MTDYKDVDDLLLHRAREYGDVEGTGVRFRALIRAMNLQDAINDQLTNPGVVYAVAMICAKLARIGYRIDHLDSWRDIEGYARLVIEELEYEQTKKVELAQEQMLSQPRYHNVDPKTAGAP